MPRPTLALLVVGLLLAAGAGAAQDADPIADKLKKAKDKFDADKKKLHAAVKAYFDKEDDKARAAKKDNAALLDKSQKDRKAFEEYGLLGEGSPKALRDFAKKAGKDIEEAYKDAADDYTKKKKDDERKAVQAEWAEVKEKGFVTAVKEPELWRPLFNGKDLTGWGVGDDKMGWKVADGSIYGTVGKQRRRLFGHTAVANFHLRFEAMYTKKAALGVSFRSGNFGSYGMTINGGGNPGTLGKWTPNKSTIYANARDAGPDGKDWVAFELVARYGTFTSYVNQVKQAEGTDADDILTKGTIVFDLNGDEGEVVRLRKIEVLTLPWAK